MERFRISDLYAAQSSADSSHALGGEELELALEAVAAVELWFEYLDKVLLQLEHLLLVLVLLQVDNRVFRALLLVLDDAPEDVARLLHVHALAGVQNEVQEVGAVIAHIPQMQVLL